MKKKKIVVSMLVVCLLCVNLLSMAVKAETTPTVHVVSDQYDFKNAVQYSQDGDIIVVYGVVDLGDVVKIGSSMDWLQIIQAVLLVAILICLVRKPKDR